MNNCINNIPLDNTDYISNIETSAPAFCDNSISDLNIDRNGCDFDVLPLSTPIQFSITFTSPATLISVSTGSQTNVNTFAVELFDSNGQLITLDDGNTAVYTSTIVNDVPTVTGIANILIDSFNIDILDTVDGQAPNDVTFGITACFPLTVNSIDVNKLSFIF
jgi:hypothetical protein